jgi:anti-anti-sigma factor
MGTVTETAHHACVSDMKLATTLQGDVLLVGITGSLDGTTSPELDAQLTTQLDCDCKHLVLDCGGLEYISSAGLRVLLMAAKRLNVPGKSFALCRVRPAVQEVLTMSGLAQVFTICNGVDEAVQRSGDA